eukprot:GHUV01030105.1.p1 GENE.GHUV01030105.1~~GHUV01030105.1.p1  ORF type:complete len:164 (+),score=30.72 GHUV01030105.1:849-1340(+)
MHRSITPQAAAALHPNFATLMNNDTPGAIQHTVGCRHYCDTRACRLQTDKPLLTNATQGHSISWSLVCCSLLLAYSAYLKHHQAAGLQPSAAIATRAGALVSIPAAMAAVTETLLLLLLLLMSSHRHMARQLSATYPAAISCTSSTIHFITMCHSTARHKITT